MFKFILLNGREKKGFIIINSYDVTSLMWLKQDC